MSNLKTQILLAALLGQGSCRHDYPKQIKVYSPKPIKQRTRTEAERAKKKASRAKTKRRKSKRGY